MLILGLTRAVRIEPFTAFRTLPSNLSSTRLIPEVAISYRVVQNKLDKIKAHYYCTPVVFVHFVRMDNNYDSSHTRRSSSDAKINTNDLTKYYFNCEEVTDCCNLLVNSHKH